MFYIVSETPLKGHNFVILSSIYQSGPPLTAIHKIQTHAGVTHNSSQPNKDGV